jgi:hypothetical protein
MRSDSAAKPSKARKPSASVNTVVKIVADCAGSNPIFCMKNGTEAPHAQAAVRLRIS